MKRVLFFFFCILLANCISPYDPQIVQENPKIVVDGLITDHAGPHKVSLAYSTAYNNNESVFGRYIEKATVIIQDSDGLQTPLNYTRAGIFETPQGMKGEVGKSYFVKVILSDGREYQSTPEELKYVPPIDTVFGEYNELKEGFLRGEFDLSLEAIDTPEKDEYYFWTWTHYEFKKYCSLIPSSYDGVTYAIKCCEDCWAIEQCNGCINILSDKLINGKKMSVPITKIPYDSKDPYFLLIEQRSLTKEAYSFWKAVSQQINNSGGIFDKPPVTIRGNLFNVNDNEEQVLGFFGASSVRTKPIYFDRSKVNKIPFGTPVIIQEFNNRCVPCSVGPFRTIIKPEGW
jgi:hypothetical protein